MTIHRRPPATARVWSRCRNAVRQLCASNSLPNKLLYQLLQRSCFVGPRQHEVSW